MSTRFKARPTEYMGVRYRSKSEAMFARMLDLNGATFVYEPECLELEDGWRPDFLSFFAVENKMRGFAIEYKPCDPTNVYLEKAASRGAEVFRRTEGFIGVHLLIASIDWYDVYDAGRVAYPDEWGTDSVCTVSDVFSWQSWTRERIVDYRYDLSEPME